MYYEEKWINGILCFRGSPNSEWTAFSMQQYKDRCIKLESKLKDREERISELEKYIKSIPFFND